MPPEPVRYYHRYRQREEAEKIYGEASLRFVYENPLGRLALWALVRRAVFSRLYGWWMDHPWSRGKIPEFLERYEVDPAEFLDPPESFRTFNEFFFRKLRPEARPVDPSPEVVTFPADGRHLAFPDFSAADGLLVKGQSFSLAELLGDRDLAARYAQGTLVLSRLCPTDYHRFHFPVAGTPGEPREIKGDLFSVNPIALRRNIDIFTRNQRVVNQIESEHHGLVTMVEVGATMVGGICYTYQPGERVEKGAEKGYFRFGGSSTLTLFEPGRIELDADLRDCSARRIELYARFGDRLGASPDGDG